MTDIIALQNTRKDIQKFIDVAFRLYKNDPKWVAPLRGDLTKTLMGVHNMLFMSGEHAFFIAEKDKKPVGRIMVGYDERFNKQVKRNQAYFSLFESIDDAECAAALFAAAEKWARSKGMDMIDGPVSPTNGDDSKGVLADDFSGPPVLMNSYNFPYYESLYLSYGFEKEEDHVAYMLESGNIDFEKRGPLIEKLMKRYDFRVDPIDISTKEAELRSAKDVAYILENGMPEGWEYTAPPDLKFVQEEIGALKPLYNGKYVYIARHNATGEPLGFVIGLPDFNQVLIHMRGSLLPFGWWHFLTKRKKIDGIRVFVQFVIHAWQKRGVTGAIYLRMLKDFRRDNMRFAEASTVGEFNLASRQTIENLGAKHYRTYRVYRKALT